MSLTATSLDQCGFCGAQMPDIATECSACGKARMRATTLSEWNAFTPKTHFAALWILSFGLYLLPWFYRMWKFLRVEMREDVRPLWRTLLMLPPIVSQVLMFRLVKDISWFTTKSDAAAFGTVMFLWGSLAAGRLAERFNDLLGIPFYALAGLAVWSVQRRINDYYATAGVTSASMPVYGWIMCGLGALVWVGIGLDLAGLVEE